MDLLKQLSQQRISAGRMAEQSVRALEGGPLFTLKFVYLLATRPGVSLSIAHVPRLDAAAMFLLISLVARRVAFVAASLAAASARVFEPIEALPPRLPHTALTSRLLPTPAAARR